MLLIGVVQMAFYYLAGATVRSDGGFGIAQPDTLLYCQAARRIVEGHPFSFSAGTAVSTGTTSVLYPFVLAIPYALGATGDALFRVGFILNAAFYLVFLLGWGLTIRAKLANPFARIVAALLVALSGQAAYCAAAQSDIGLWMAVSALMIMGFATNRAAVYAPALLIAPWIRPEGMICALAFSACAIGVRFFRRKEYGEKLGALLPLAALASVCGVFALNAALTGTFGFSSVANKGHFHELPLCDALAVTAIDAMTMFKSLFIGIPQLATRNFYYLPVVVAALAWLGVFVRKWGERDSWRDAALALAFVGSFGTVAMSGWQGTNMDRYLAWFLPAVLLLAAEGAGWVAARVDSRVVRMLPAAIVVSFGFCASVFCIAVFASAVRVHVPLVAFSKRCDAEMSAGKSVALYGSCGFAYEFSPRRVAHLPGIYSPEFSVGDSAAVVEIVKRERDTRFDYWLFTRSETGALGVALEKASFGVVGEMLLAGPRKYELRKADWSAFDHAAENPDSGRDCTVLKERIDVGYLKDEKAHRFEPVTIFDQPTLKPFVACDKLNGKYAVDAGRVLLGGAEMTVALQPGKDAYVVLRTMAKATAFASGASGADSGGEFSFKSPMTLMVEVDGGDVGPVRFEIADNGFTDATFKIPGSAITSSPCRIAFIGEHASCGYWFYQ